jgi:hypothetical protein
MPRVNLDWTVFPHLPEVAVDLSGLEVMGAKPAFQDMPTLYEGVVRYWKLWNFWARPVPTLDPKPFFPAYEQASTDLANLLAAIAVPSSAASSEEIAWNRIRAVWQWLAQHTKVDATAYAALLPAGGTGWPSIQAYAQHYAAHGYLPWAACFSRAQVMATILGRLIPRWRVAIAEAHHTEGGAPPTASHVFIAAYVDASWFYFDPTFVQSIQIPAFAQRASVGTYTLVDYTHPHSAIPVPGSPLDRVPYVGA